MDIKKDNTHSKITPVENPPEHIATALRVAIEMKGLDVVGFDVRGVTDITDYIVVASGTSQRHVTGIVDKLLENLSKEGNRPASKNGYDSGDWIILDYIDFVIHVFYQPIRDFYQIEELWPLAPHISLPEELEQAAKRFRSEIR